MSRAHDLKSKSLRNSVFCWLGILCLPNVMDLCSLYLLRYLHSILILLGEGLLFIFWRGTSSAWLLTFNKVAVPDLLLLDCDCLIALQKLNGLLAYERDSDGWRCIELKKSERQRFIGPSTSFYRATGFLQCSYSLRDEWEQKFRGRKQAVPQEYLLFASLS